MQKREFDKKKCKICGRLCLLPSWTYCSEPCNRIAKHKFNTVHKSKIR